MTDADRLATLDRLFEGFNAHDAEAVMACFAPAAVFLAAGGSEADGQTIAGLDAIRAAFVAVWTDMPDVQWKVRRSRVLGDEGVTEWLFTGTKADGTRIEAEGLDLFAFEGALVVRKNAFRKQRPALKAA